jgi:Calpain family cysteine protease
VLRGVVASCGHPFFVSVANVEAAHAAGQSAVTTAAQIRAAYGGERATANSNELFPNGLPSLDALRQGMLGDCYFIAALGGMLARDPSSIVRMIRRNLDGNAVTSYTVTFAGAIGAQTVAPPTDGELARYSSSGIDGLWLPVIEKAYAQGRGGAGVNRQTEIGEGGSISSGIDAFTAGGTDSDDLWCTDVATTKTKLQNALNGRPAKIVTANLASENDLHLPSGHAYTVLAFDGSVMTLRNPWGHHPANVPATAAGFVRRPNGQFTMTPELFDSIFFQISYQE